MSFRPLLVLVILSTAIFTGCTVLRTTGKTAKVIGKVGWTTAKVTSKVVYHTGKATYKTGKFASKTIRTVVYMAKGRQIIPLERVGNSLYAHVKLNKNVPARLLIDTGASSTLISSRLARVLGINLAKGEQTYVTMANGGGASATQVIIREIRLGSVRVAHVEALVLDQRIDDGDGLLGMSFLNHFVFQIDADKPELILQQKAK